MAMAFFKKSPSDKLKLRSKDRVGRGEFRRADLVDAEMPDTVRIIGESGFRECRKLRRVQLSNALCEIGAYAFRDCDMLENVVMPGEMRYPDGTPGLLGIGCFEHCGLLRDITIPEGVAVIGANAFLNCAALEFVTLPKSVKAIRSGAFSGCSRLKYLKYQSLPDLIAADAFLNTPQQEKIAALRKPVLTIMHTSSFSLPQIYQFSASSRLIGTEQTDTDMSVMLDDLDETRVCFRMQYRHAGGSHVVPANTPTRLFYEEYDCQGRAGIHKEEIIASYR